MINPAAHRTLSVALCGLFGLLCVASVVVTTDTYWLRPVTNFVWHEAATGGECAATVLSTPHISQARIVDFASDAAVTINSYDYYNQGTVIGSALRQYFTVTGRDSYIEEVSRSGSPLAFRRNYVEQTAYKNGVPNIKEEGFIKGRRFWRVEVPLLQYRRSNVDVTEAGLLLTMLVVSVRPSVENPNGIGIDSITATTLLNYDR
ncbi:MULTISPECIES: DotI/IcmL family type IV secretion protein [Hyphomicrobiales]|uniref:DotI/IcmL family type IV secretion protein n=1 Tax=Hyphomicrobiales TaxID=356 RepID=UPI000F684C99|nr:MULTISPECIES: DotI/IcmL family type IV secretion protein [Hyphomicrobiales]MDH1270288.1 DotI/IcmL family type IV secretion protein [Agrobacterium pusense]MDX4076699.1 DotI/IcmL family type IV secretion protein [Brucella sp. NBRC 113783]RSC24764.1 hypothetical protein EGT36_28470 [Agrobacterium sp. FDAARGOS_525]